jgi:hypothetical protein
VIESIFQKLEGGSMCSIAMTLPPLENGDHLNRVQFEHRYQAMSRVKKAELLEGIVYMASPLHYDSHAEPHAVIITWLGNYCAATPQCH